MSKISKSNAEWRQELSPEQYRVTREHGTERPWSHPYNHEKRDGTYVCASCGKPLFSAETKYESGSGWPSFYKPASAEAVTEHVDRSLLMKRVESAAPIARPISAMFSRTARSPPACAIA